MCSQNTTHPDFPLLNKGGTPLIRVKFLLACACALLLSVFHSLLLWPHKSSCYLFHSGTDSAGELESVYTLPSLAVTWKVNITMKGRRKRRSGLSVCILRDNSEPHSVIGKRLWVLALLGSIPGFQSHVSRDNTAALCQALKLWRGMRV